MTQRILHTGFVGFNYGFEWGHNAPSDEDIDADNDLELIPAPEFVIDLSAIASSVLGYQASMMKGYKLHGYSVSIRPRDDAYDNDQAAQFAGFLECYPASSHAMKALQMARKVEKADEASQVDADSLFLSDDNDYSGFRYGWSTYQPANTTVHPTGNSISGMHDWWVVSEIFGAYDDMTEPGQSNALFGGRAPEMMRLPWRCGWGTYPSGNPAGTGGFDCGNDYSYKTALDILPLLRGQVRYSSGDEEGSTDDDYYVVVTVEFTPEVGGGF